MSKITGVYSYNYPKYGNEVSIILKNEITTLVELMSALFQRPGMVVLRNEGGAVELKGDDLTFKEHGHWITIYHGSEASSETRSHIHLKINTYTYAVVRETEGYTPQMTFWPSKLSVAEDKPPFAIYFPRFFDWSNGKTPIVENQEHYKSWIASYGSEFQWTIESENEKETS